jgi:DNA-binding NtrC family response regulator
MKLLIVDDEVKLLELLKGFFALKGDEVFGTGRGEEALNLLQQHQPDVCLLDLRLKGSLDGEAVLAEAKRLSPNTKVIIITGDDHAPKDTLLQAGATAFLRKPIRFDELTQLVQQLSGSAASP